jgi:hypothetical protein
VGIPSNKNARKKALENGDIPELINDLVNEALGDKFSEEEIEKLTIKGLFNILRGDDAEIVEKEDTVTFAVESASADAGEKEKEAIEKRAKQTEAYNNYLKLQKDYDTEREIRAQGKIA